MSFIAIYITHPNEITAKKISGFLIQKKLVACANIYPIQSAYWWKEKIQNENEWVSLVKTRSELWDQVREAIEEVHPYEVPCIVKYRVEANAAYETWIHAETKDP